MPEYARRLTDTEEEKVALWRTILTRRVTSLRPIVYACSYICVPGVGAMGRTDAGGRIFIDPLEWDVAGWSDDECAQVLGLLAIDVMLGHSAQAKDILAERGTFSPDLWQTACHVAINCDLAELGLCFPSTVSATAAALGAPEGLAAVDYYDDLEQRANIAGLTHLMQDVSSLMGDLFPALTLDDIATMSDDELAELGVDRDGFADEFKNGPWEDLDTMAPPVPTYTLVSAADEVAVNIIKSAGSSSGNLVRWARDVVAPSLIDWRAVIAPHIRGAVAKGTGRGKRSTNRLNRRMPHVKVSETLRALLLGTERRRPFIVVVPDTSGSVTDAELGEMVREVEVIARAAGTRPGDLVIVPADDAVYSPSEFTDAESLRRTVLAGGGGTDMRVPLATIEDMFERTPDLVIVMTDGGTPWPETAPAFGMVALITSRGRDSTPPWLEAVMMGGTVAA